jgi:hypothetical protein
MEIFVLWLALSILAGIIASRKGRSGIGFFLLSLILSPLVGIIAALVVGQNIRRVEEKQIASNEYKKCPYCAEIIKKEAIACKCCGKDLRDTSLANETSPITQAHSPSVGEVETIRPRVVEIPPGVENQKLSIREAAHIIGVTTSTLQGYIYSGRLTANPDDTIDLYALYHAGFIVRNLPQKETRP